MYVIFLSVDQFYLTLLSVKTAGILSTVYNVSSLLLLLLLLTNSGTEPFNDNGTWRSNVFYNTIGPNYVNIALQAARAADPSAKLYVSISDCTYASYIPMVFNC